MMKKTRETYEERAQKLALVVDIAQEIINTSSKLPDFDKKEYLKLGQLVKEYALNPRKGFKRMDSLKYLESDYFAHWNEIENPEGQRFWTELYKKGLYRERRNIIEKVLKRNKIKNIAEFEFINDTIVVAEQTGHINETQSEQLNKLMGDFEFKQKKK
ncbi:hypothetical protein KEM09_20410 [Carboxylicivirga mesophila]|uniref:Uncharacterized protein n=1 Tax=Carboxylicivirga mesophila TaxID=1166478 RepID=A0ABS5KIA9_9BACT|nr:hypothetical protein [Carboxylicivirga mesophila]MBS2213783.1 hypothetical protein [Carboxylicivirga mesophila]